MSSIHAVACDTCKALHYADSDTYTELVGGEMVIKGHNTILDGIYCRKFDCISWILNTMAPDAIKKPAPLLVREHINVPNKSPYTMQCGPLPPASRDIVIGEGVVRCTTDPGTADWGCYDK